MNQKNSRKKINSLMLIVAFTAIMLIVSTYAWFTTQNNVLLKGLEGKVSVAEGLQISLDAKTWTQTIDFSDFDTTTATAWTSGTYLPTEGATFQTPYSYVESATTMYAKNTIPDVLTPVSTSDMAIEAIGLNKINMYEGTLTEGIKLSSISAIADENAGKYYAFDLFLQNTASVDDLGTEEQLKLDTTTRATVMTDGNADAGLQNAIRVAFALYENNLDNVSASQAEKDAVTVDKTPTVDEIISGTAVGKTIKDVAIWEPNANAHVQPILDSNNTVTWSKTDIEDTAYDLAAIAGSVTGESKAVKFAATTKVPTYGLKAAAVTAGTINDIYNWAAPTTMAKQYTVQTETGFGGNINDEATGLVSATDGTTTFTIGKGEYQKIRVYVWIEGQDVDCTNYASLGKGITLNLGLTK